MAQEIIRKSKKGIHDARKVAEVAEKSAEPEGQGFCKMNQNEPIFLNLYMRETEKPKTFVQSTTYGRST